MALNGQQLQDELQRKKNLGLAPTNAANVVQYNKLTPQVTSPQNKVASGSIAAATPTTGQMNARQYLQNQGVNNSDIGFNNGQVTVKGMGFLLPTSNVNGQSFATKDNLDGAWRQYQMNQGQQKANGLMGNYEKAIDTPYAAYTPAQAFAYNMETDPAYQAALQSAMANAQTAQNNAMVGLGSRGIGNSSTAVTAANQIQQNALGSVTRDVLPGLISQAYQRYADAENQRYQHYRDQYGMSRDHLGDLGNLLGIQQGMNQQLSAEDQRALDNAQTQWQNRFQYGNTIGTFGNGQQTMASRQFNADEAQRGKDNQFRNDQFLWQKSTDSRDYDRGVLESDRNFNSSEDQRGKDNQFRTDQFTWQKSTDARDYNRGVYESDRSYKSGQANRNSDNARADNNAEYGRLMDVWKANGIAPKGLEKYGVQPNTPYGGQQSQAPSYGDATKDIDNSLFIQKALDKDGEPTGQYSVTDPAGLADYIFGQNLSESDTKKLFQRYGLKWGG
ncbi:hypothetical protein [Paenibacillus albus]|uniref:Uncharacterized protein n=1 Tax=Paenibacillus albus TaxID=2495582 RepID=A0A3Q8XBL6_9BACL|nr:hypothetical protein [Paenibacillus albus]AZN43355.1 hypothetical protein EJC50_29440 [Paenibacillus albus]